MSYTQEQKSMKENEEKIICPFCNAPYTREMVEQFNESFGCESGCLVSSIRIICEACKKIVYVKGDFGEAETVEEKEEVIDDLFTQENVEGREEI